MWLWDAMYTYVVLAQAALFANVETSNAGRSSIVAVSQVAGLLGTVGPSLG